MPSGAIELIGLDYKLCTDRIQDPEFYQGNTRHYQPIDLGYAASI